MQKFLHSIVLISHIDYNYNFYDNYDFIVGLYTAGPKSWHTLF